MKSIAVVSWFLLVGSAAAQDLPTPPVPPDHPPQADGAPVPNIDAQAPLQVKEEGTSVNVMLYRAHYFDPSMGFAPGSKYQSSEDRKAIQTPGFSVTVPLK
jgi:hypothetical protein